MDRKRNGQLKIILWNQSIFPFSLLSECFNPHRQNYQFIRTFSSFTYLPKYKVLFFIFVCLIYGKTSYLFNQEGKSRFHLDSLVLFLSSIPLFKLIITLTFGVSTKLKVQNNKRKKRYANEETNEEKEETRDTRMNRENGRKSLIYRH